MARAVWRRSRVGRVARGRAWAPLGVQRGRAAEGGAAGAVSGAPAPVARGRERGRLAGMEAWLKKRDRCARRVRAAHATQQRRTRTPVHYRAPAARAGPGRAPHAAPRAQGATNSTLLIAGWSSRVSSMP